jgi:hypothetical protein
LSTAFFASVTGSHHYFKRTFPLLFNGQGWMIEEAAIFT